MALLKLNGLIECRRDGKHNYYRILPERFGQLAQLLFRALPTVQLPIRFQQWVLCEADSGASPVASNAAS